MDRHYHFKFETSQLLFYQRVKYHNFLLKKKSDANLCPNA